jgi:Tol biopolymer transport system component
MKDHDTTAMVYLASVEDAAPRAEQLFAAPAPMDTINHVVWSPDGQQVVMALADYSSMDEETYEVDGALAIVSADGATSRVIELPEALDPEIQITWSPDGRYVAFVDYWHPENEDALDNSTFEYPGVISIVELAHDTLQPVVTVDSPSVDGVNAISFDWSPDSRSLVYISTEGTLETHLFRIDIDGSNRQQLTPEGAGFGVIFDIAWAPLPQQP